MIGLVLALHLAAGLVVDVGATAQLRGSALAENVAAGTFPLQSQLSVTPLVRAVVEDGDVRLDGSYAPQLSVIAPSRDVLLLLHQMRGRFEYRFTPRWTFSSDLQGAVGDLDAGTALRTIPTARNAPLGNGLTSLPFGQVVVTTATRVELTPRWTSTTTLRLDFAGTPQQVRGDVVTQPTQLRTDLGTTITHLLTAVDSVSASVLARTAAVAPGPDDLKGRAISSGFVGLQPTLTYHRTLLRGVVSDTEIGLLSTMIDDGSRRGGLLAVMPIVDQRVQASINLSGDSAIDGRIGIGLAPFSGPFGGLLEQRVQLAAQVNWRIDRAWSTSFGATAFGVVTTAERTPADTEQAQNAAVLSSGVAWQFHDDMALTSTVLLQTRMLSDRFGVANELRSDATVLVGFTFGTNVLRIGARPAGTDLRAGRNIATRPVVLAGRRPMTPVGFGQRGDAVDIKTGGQVREDAGGRINNDIGGRIKDDSIGGRLRLETRSPAERKAKLAAEAEAAAADAKKPNVDKLKAKPAPLPTTTTAPAKP